jgi:hypothetical protein
MNTCPSFPACVFFLLTTLTGAQSPVTESEPAQRWSQQACPRVGVSCPSSFKEGEPIIFTVDVIGGDPKVVPSYNWSISAGRIIEGQGTSSIKVDTLGFGQAFTGTVSISGFDQICPATASCSIIPGTPAPPAVLFDRYYPKSTVKVARKKLRARRRVIRRH